MKEKIEKYKYVFVFLSLLTAFSMYSIHAIYGFELVPDEFGYWSYAAVLSGCDWSEVVSIGSYYSFGYTSILYPIFRLCRNSVDAYKTAVMTNYVLLAVSFFLIWKLLTVLQNRQQNAKYTDHIVSFSVMTAVFYPSWLYYARMTMTEILVMCMYAVICVFMYLYLENNKLWELTGLVLSLVYIYTVHMRTVGILIAALITIGIHTVNNYQCGGKYYLAKVAMVLSAGILLLFVADKIKLFISQEIYTPEAGDRFARNDYGGQIGKLKGIFTAEGFRNLIISVTGKVWYLGLASFGLFYWGIWICVKRLCKEKKLIYFFLLLAAAGEIGITSIYISGVNDRIDGLTYGRYNEQILPILMALGCIAVTEAKSVYRQTLLIAAAQFPVLCLLIYVVTTYQQTNIHAYMSLGISYFYDQTNFEPVSFHVTAYLTAVVLMAAVIVLLRMTKKRQTELFMAGIIIIELVLGVRLASVFAQETQLANFRDIQIIEIVQEELQEHDRLVYLQEGDRALVDNLQFQLREEKVYLERDIQNITKHDLVVTDYLYSRIEELKEKYSNWRIMGHFAIFYN